MSIRSFLGLGAPASAPSSGETPTVRKIVRELENMDRDRAHYVAAFAFILSRVANADRQISEQETRRMEQIVQRIGHLPEAQAVLVVQIAKAQNQLFGGTDNFIVTREFKRLASREQRAELLDCLFAVSAADDAVSSVEETVIRQIAEELEFSHRDYISVRSQYADKRSVLRSFRDRQQD
ncbi:MAG: TerB family tellurite resistance protein [Acidobacteriota bacterium]|nr:MAG: TerB family tellurite resistance protein [Acidobacteriota bacterium]